jgi:hypothetical protein
VQCSAMPRAPRHRPLAPDARQAALPLPPARRKPPTPEQIARAVTGKLKSPVGMPEKAELALRVVLHEREGAEQLGHADSFVGQIMPRKRREGSPAWAAPARERNWTKVVGLCLLTAPVHYEVGRPSGAGTAATRWPVSTRCGHLRILSLERGLTS